MCRFTLYLGPPITLGSLLTEPTHSLIHQSFGSRERSEPLNGDGFGVAWWSALRPERAASFKAITPAWNNLNLLELAPVVESHAVLAHIRAATQGTGISEVNCHPFTAGRYAFMHNGDVGGFPRVRRHILSAISDEAFAAVRGSTDSEHVFAIFLDEAKKQNGGLGDVEPMARALEATIGRVVELVKKHAPGGECWLNLAVSDGRAAVVSRVSVGTEAAPSSLYMNTGRRYICKDGMCSMVEPENHDGAVLVSSEPLSEDPGWSPVPPSSLVRIDASGTAKIKPFTI